MEQLNILRNIVDFGIVIVVWLAQVIMYPSLAHINENVFVSWHRSYSQRIAFFVIPLLTGQAAIAAYMIALDRNAVNNLLAVIIAFCWASTFGISVPLHAKLQRYGKDLNVIRRLVMTNLIRTILWTIVFAIGLWVTFSPKT